MKHRQQTPITVLRKATTTVITAAVLAAPTTAAVAASDGADRPSLGTCDTVVTVIGGFGFPLEPLELRIDLTCRFRHLGHVTGVILQETTATGPVGADGILPSRNSASIAYTAANGDVLYSDFSGPATINVVTGAVSFEGEEVFVGGTGRFAQASGTSWLEGTASTVTNVGFYVTSGTLSY